MKKWKNPYITLRLSPSASSSDIRQAEKNFGFSEEEKKTARAEKMEKNYNIAEDEKTIARAAREELTQNVNNIFPAFLTGVDNIISLDAEVKQLRRSNQGSPKFTDEIKNDAFFQMGVLAPANSTEKIEVDISKIKELAESVTLKTMINDIGKNDKGSSSIKPEAGELKSSVVVSFKIPHFIK